MEILTTVNDSPAFITVMTSGCAQRRVSGISHSVGNGAHPNKWNQEDDGLRTGRRRSRIPEKPNHTLSLWSVIKNCLGKELSKIPMPVNFNEPLSMLQRLTEDLEYSELLDMAAACRSSLDQLCYVAAFSASSYSTTANRTTKPFNPLLGETYELDRLEECGYRSICEQVSHHPPAAAHHVWSQRGWSLWQEITIDSKFCGKCISVTPRGTIHLQFHSSGNHYTWSKVTSTVHNIILGKLWIDQSGDIEIINHVTKESCQLKFSPYSYFSRDVSRKVSGVVMDSENVACFILSGTWDDKIDCTKIIGSSQAIGGQKTLYKTESPWQLWRKYPLPENAENMYYFSSLALTLNELEEGVGPTDSRLRPDQRLMEAGLWSEASAEKQRLEEKQRERRKRREGGVEGEVHWPLWFERRTDPFTGENSFVYKGGYWEAKSSQDWSMCPEIF
ncbi:hypothetical protein AGOR_G00011010 [Albula goreensis]|uniref:Oxysterol-binding protein n=1 Tax=Albula goreensis TaxID=1534307 RepID=A0A8T3E9F6_9TELE|nr:hypothetical protein AGOR_G00011010 [Albula goreensis]